jgi:hypothetical protein
VGRFMEDRRKGDDPLDTANSIGSVVMICPNLKCRRVLQVPSKFRGQHVKCRYCSLTFAVPHLRLDTRPADDRAEEAPDPKGKDTKKGEGGKEKK